MWLLLLSVLLILVLVKLVPILNQVFPRDKHQTIWVLLTQIRYVVDSMSLVWCLQDRAKASDIKDVWAVFFIKTNSIKDILRKIFIK